MTLNLDKWYSANESGAWKDKHEGVVNFSALSDRIQELSALVAARVAEIKSRGSAISVADMFDLQASMNKLSQISEGASGVIAGLNAACSAISRNIKG